MISNCSQRQIIHRISQKSRDHATRRVRIYTHGEQKPPRSKHHSSKEEPVISLGETEREPEKKGKIIGVEDAWRQRLD